MAGPGEGRRHVAGARREHRPACHLREIVASPLPHAAGEDSYSFLSTLLGESTGQPPRPTLVTDSMMGLFAIQEGPWKLIEGQGGGGYFPQGPPSLAVPSPADPPGQLYHLGDDLGETRNRYAEKPEIVARLKALLEQIQTNRQTRPSGATRQDLRNR